jgi:hypothetical protein
MLTEQYLAESTQKHLAAGCKVLLLSKLDQLPHSIEGGFQCDFWFPMFVEAAKKQGGKVPPGTLGILCDPNSPALAEFPTEFHSIWQWWQLVKNARPIMFDETPMNTTIIRTALLLLAVSLTQTAFTMAKEQAAAQPTFDQLFRKETPVVEERGVHMHLIASATSGPKLDHVAHCGGGIRMCAGEMSRCSRMQLKDGTRNRLLRSRRCTSCRNPG